MKTRTETKTYEVHWYICEYCGKEMGCWTDMKDHEKHCTKRCGCGHEYPKTYEFCLDIPKDWLFVVKRCSSCNKKWRKYFPRMWSDRTYIVRNFMTQIEGEWTEVIE